ncbi:hypothetical protein L6452_29700 [Arctium lappa]|uniref:Uncharacterized protein n=1 Tax=Arctium lappa TaxID=4217 RepID=A0ACB8ZIB2_ARCLA|nr:hypothetical protein L6452_29700 [Arctium lappa]
MTTTTMVVSVLHIEVWVRLHLESRSTLADWSIMLPDFMYYMTELKDLSYLTQQCNGAQGSAGFPAWGTVNKAPDIEFETNCTVHLILLITMKFNRKER